MTPAVVLISMWMLSTTLGKFKVSDAMEIVIYGNFMSIIQPVSCAFYKHLLCSIS